MIADAVFLRAQWPSIHLVIVFTRLLKSWKFGHCLRESWLGPACYLRSGAWLSWAAVITSVSAVIFHVLLVSHLLLQLLPVLVHEENLSCPTALDSSKALKKTPGKLCTILWSFIACDKRQRSVKVSVLLTSAEAIDLAGSVDWRWITGVSQLGLSHMCHV